MEIVIRVNSVDELAAIFALVRGEEIQGEALKRLASDLKHGTEQLAAAEAEAKQQ